jgi:hypothetical protein
MYMGWSGVIFFFTADAAYLVVNVFPAGILGRL